MNNVLIKVYIDRIFFLVIEIKASCSRMAMPISGKTYRVATEKNKKFSRVFQGLFQGVLGHFPGILETFLSS